MKHLWRIVLIGLFAIAVSVGDLKAQEQIDAVQLQRLQNVVNGISVRFYTTDQREIDRLVSDRTWQVEGTVGWVFPRQAVGTTALYRLALNKNGRAAHFFTTHIDEANKAWTDGYSYEGIAGYVASTQLPGTTAFRRLSNTQIGHFYTTNADEALNAVKSNGYIDEGNEGFVWGGPASLPAAPAPNILHKRIAGSKYIQLDEKDSADHWAAQNGYLCVVHNAGCNPTIFTAGNSGEDTFFSRIKHLPIGANLDSYSIVPFWPKCLAPQFKGGIGRSGSYGQRVTSSKDPLAIGWENSCTGDYASKNIYYSITLFVSYIEGVDLGEETFDTTPQSPIPSCAPSDYTSVDTPCAAPPPTVSTILDTLRLPKNGGLGDGFVWYSDIFPAPGLVFTGSSPDTWQILSFANGNQFRMFFLKPGMSTDQCFESSSGVVVEPAGKVSATSLYGVETLHAPITILACIDNGTTIPQAIVISITYRH